MNEKRMEFMTMKRIVLAVVLLLWSGSAGAATITVNTATDETTDNTTCSLREAVISANSDSNAAEDACTAGSGADIINVPAGTYNLTGAGCEDAAATGDLDVTRAVTINGAGAATTIIDANDTDRIFDLFSNNGLFTVTISNLTIRDGTAQTGQAPCAPGGNGGAIQVGFGVTLNLNDSIVETSLADEGGGIYNNNVLNVDESTIRNNIANTSGGGVCNTASVTATITNSTISGNQAGVFPSTEGNGGGLANDNSATLTVVNSTISGNSAISTDNGTPNGNGGGIFLAQFSQADIRNVTITNNRADDEAQDSGGGGGIFVAGTGSVDNAIARIRNTIIAGNFDDSPTSGDAPDCDGIGTVTSQGFNLVGIVDGGCSTDFGAGGDQTGTSGSPLNPLLDPLANYGGPTETHQLQLASPAVDLANPAGCFNNTNNDGTPLTRDQRDFPRPVDGDGDATVRCDIGAFELQILPACGDGTVDAGEECDDGNTSDGDGCSANCTVESGCGNGTVEGTEECDDGNNVDGDGCSANCTNEVPPDCGDGILQAGEACDDGNTTDGDGCSANCTVETGFDCDTRTSPTVCTPTDGGGDCGDGSLDSGEECDDGNNTAGDGCSANCTVETGFACTDKPGDTSECASGCGDGEPAFPEECDDGDNTDGDGCSAICRIEGTPAVYCAADPANCVILLLGDGGCGLAAASTSGGATGLPLLIAALVSLVVKRRFLR
jgi:CSLREA domain-containing protein